MRFIIIRETILPNTLSLSLPSIKQTVRPGNSAVPLSLVQFEKMYGIYCIMQILDFSTICYINKQEFCAFRSNYVWYFIIFCSCWVYIVLQLTITKVTEEIESFSFFKLNYMKLSYTIALDGKIVASNRG